MESNCFRSGDIFEDHLKKLKPNIEVEMKDDEIESA